MQLLLLLRGSGTRPGLGLRWLWGSVSRGLLQRGIRGLLLSLLRILLLLGGDTLDRMPQIASPFLLFGLFSFFELFTAQLGSFVDALRRIGGRLWLVGDGGCG